MSPRKSDESSYPPPIPVRSPYHQWTLTSPPSSPDDLAVVYRSIAWKDKLVANQSVRESLVADRVVERHAALSRDTKAELVAFGLAVARVGRRIDETASDLRAVVGLELDGAAVALCQAAGVCDVHPFTTALVAVVVVAEGGPGAGAGGGVDVLVGRDVGGGSIGGGLGGGQLEHDGHDGGTEDEEH